MPNLAPDYRRQVFWFVLLIAVSVQPQLSAFQQREIPADIRAQVDGIAGICELASLEEQVIRLTKHLHYLKIQIPEYTREYSDSIDTLRLREMYSHLFDVDMAVYWDWLKVEQIREHNIDFASGFLSQNRRMYNLPDEASEHENGWRYLMNHWEHQVYSGLTCIGRHKGDGR